MIPYFKHDGLSHKLYVDGRSFLALGGEIRNSSSSNLAYMEEKVWPNVRGLNLNTIIAPVYWELVEPEEGRYDFGLVEGLIDQARREKVRLVLLWFGLWKNGMSTYAPGWIKKDLQRCYRIRDSYGRPINAVSPLCDYAVQKDGTALAKLMAHLKTIDGDQNTVIMVQVENEMGILGSERDYSEQAEELYCKEVPSEITELYNATGSWESAFGDEAPETFMAYHYARATEKIVSMAAAEYNLPMFVNAWLEQFPHRAGTYPSGGPIAKYLKLWRKIAPSLVLYAPDIYVSQFDEVCAEYTADGNPLFIPEARFSADSAYNVFTAIGKYDAICFAPFAIEDLVRYEDAATLLSGSYGILGNMQELILSSQGTGRMKGFSQYDSLGETLSFDNYDVIIRYTQNGGCSPKGGGIIIQTGPDDFVFAGMNFRAEVLAKKGEGCLVDYLYLEEGRFDNDSWIPCRRLNGDEYHLAFGSGPYVIKCGVYKYN
ncbi:MAG: DUF5597 domain-containing protein [Oscillospiraceae bacterium]|nr:DUF5597 domain-containing protein [Oscillospiraceae bacterium]